MRRSRALAAGWRTEPGRARARPSRCAARSCRRRAARRPGSAVAERGRDQLRRRGRFRRQRRAQPTRAVDADVRNLRLAGRGPAARGSEARPRASGGYTAAAIAWLVGAPETPSGHTRPDERRSRNALHEAFDAVIAEPTATLGTADQELRAAFATFGLPPTATLDKPHRARSRRASARRRCAQRDLVAACSLTRCVPVPESSR